MITSALLPLLPLLGAGLTTALPQHAVTTPSHRLSLSFGPSHPHKTFSVLSHDVDAAVEFDGDWRGVVSTFLKSEIRDDWYIRDDVSIPATHSLHAPHPTMRDLLLMPPQSYTDTHTGVTHVYVRQLLHGLEVADGDINLNVDASGRILSWGSSFHPASADQPEPFTATVAPANTEHCNALADQIAELKPSGPWTLVKSAAKAAFGLSVGDDNDDGEAVDASRLQHLAHHHAALCRPALSSGSMLSPADALAHILPSLNPSAQPLSAGALETHSEHTLAPKAAPAEPPTQHISGPGLATAGVINPVPARLVYTQVDSGLPRLVWKLEVEMKENWYEAYVDSFSGELVRIVDWASDISWGSPSADLKKGGKQKPLPVPHKKYKPYSYHVFPWGK